MIHAMLILLAAQLAGDTLARMTGAPLPGPVVGMLILLAGLATFPKLADLMRPLTSGILGHLSLLFVPAGTGVVGHLDSLAAHGPALAIVLIISTVAAIAAGALTFALVARLTGSEPDA